MAGGRGKARVLLDEGVGARGTGIRGGLARQQHRAAGWLSTNHRAERTGFCLWGYWVTDDGCKNLDRTRTDPSTGSSPRRRSSGQWETSTEGRSLWVSPSRAMARNLQLHRPQLCSHSRRCDTVRCGSPSVGRVAKPAHRVFLTCATCRGSR